MLSVKPPRPAGTSLRLPVVSQAKAAQVEAEGREMVGDQQALAAPAAHCGKQRLWSLRDALATHESAEAAQLELRGPQVSTVSSVADPASLLEVEPMIPGGLSETGFEQLAEGISSVPPTDMACLYLLGFDVPTATAAIAGGLAKSLVRQGSTVLLVDADLELGGLSRGAGQCERRGLIEILNRSTLWRQALYPTSHDGLTFLPAGRGAVSRTGIDTARWGTLLQDFRSRFTHVVVSGGGWGADSVMLARACDRTMPVIKLGVTLRAQVEQRVRTLCRAGVATTGCVVID